MTLLVVGGVLAGLSLSGGSSPVTVAGHSGGARAAAGGSGARDAPAGPRTIPAAEAGVMPWSVGPVSREVVLPAAGTDVTVVGGLSASGASMNQVVALDTASGHTTAVGNLPAANHDGAGAVVGGHGYLFGGGSPATVPTVDSFDLPPATVTGATYPNPAITGSPQAPAPIPSAAPTTPAATSSAGAPPGAGGTAPSPAPAAVASGASSVAVAAGQAVATLPQPRSDAVAATIGRTAYVIGGYDGAKADPAVLATTDGTHFATVANLPVPVRYPAVATLGAKIYVFGGEAVGGASSGQPVDAIQVVDPQARSATLAGHLTQSLAGASAFVLGGDIYLAGGVDGAAGAGIATSSAGAATTTRAPTAAATSIWAYDPSTGKTLAAGNLPVATSYAGAAVVGNRAWLIGGEDNGVPMGSVEMVTQNRSFGTAGAPGAGSPFFGNKLLIADRGNNRMFLVDPTGSIEWMYPSATMAPPPGPNGFYFPDDTFFAKHGTEIISNQEENETIVAIAYPSGKLLWSYGHPGHTGSSPGYLHEPDDAYLLPNGQITVADAVNCRVLVINPDGTIASQIGTTGECVHHPPTSMGSPNGDTPLADGNLLVSEINGSWVSEYTPAGQLVWTAQLALHYPSDPQQIGPDTYLIADYANPGSIVEFNRQGQILYRYQGMVGLGRMDQPSLVEQLPSGVFMANDDYRDRMVAIDPATGALVWQYGTPDKAGTAPGLLNTPDGFDLLQPNGSTPTHPYTG
ncbi:MAG TPA: PQQ-binding-like beta-propeller repeat protein [Acidimicrobiales bacterium]|nr:PQQ-binding-like beta-propeller repeat protein [Acidimicrobiales bacterium]